MSTESKLSEPLGPECEWSSRALWGTPWTPPTVIPDDWNLTYLRDIESKLTRWPPRNIDLEIENGIHLSRHSVFPWQDTPEKRALYELRINIVRTFNAKLFDLIAMLEAIQTGLEQDLERIQLIASELLVWFAPSDRDIISTMDKIIDWTKLGALSIEDQWRSEVGLLTGLLRRQRLSE